MKPVWRASRPFVILGAALSVLILGTIGFTEDEGLDTLDALYKSIQLFGFGGGVEPDPPLELQIARFLGPLIVGYATVRGLIALFREQMQLLTYRAALRNHVVIAGLGEVGHHLANRFNDLGAPVVVLESDSANPLIPACRDRGIGVLAGSAVEPVALRHAQIRRASYMVISCGHDQVDIEVAMAARRASRGRRGVLTAFVNIGDPSLWRVVKARALSEAGPRPIRLEPFNLLDSGASLAVESADPFGAGERSPTVLIAGDGGMAQMLALHAARVRLNAGGSGLEVELVGATAEEERDSLLGRHPELNDVCSLTATRISPEDKQLGRRARDAEAVFVGYKDEAVGLAAALAFRECTRRDDVPVVLIVRESAGGAAQAAEAAGVRVFGLFSEALGDEFLDRGMNEVMARAMHEEYVSAQTAKGETLEQNPSLVPWEELPSSLRQSNRRAVDGIGPRLNEVGAVVVPSPLVQIESEGFEFTDEELERLAELEHERWMRDLTDEGWAHREGPKDPVRKRHPSLVPWEQLSEEERQKDRDAVLATPRILHRAGYAIERLDGTDG